MDEYFELDELHDNGMDELDIDLSEIEGNDPARARFIKGYLKAKI